MKKILFLLFLGLASNAFSDWTKKVQAKGITCLGQGDKGHISLSAHSLKEGTFVQAVGENFSFSDTNSASLSLSMEGNCYVQQVSNDLGYNLSFSVPCESEGTVKMKSVKGMLWFFKPTLKEEQSWQLNCQVEMSIGKLE